MKRILKLFKRKGPKKTWQLCDSCHYKVFGPNCKDCRECDNRGALGGCNCVRVAYGDPCKYYKKGKKL